MSEKLPPNIFTTLDLELNQDLVTGPRIIQIGAVVGNLQNGEILEKLSLFVNPKQVLMPEIVKLTKIKQEQVDNAGTLLEAYEKLKEVHEKHKSFINLVVWGSGDLKALTAELGIGNLCFGRREIDVKTLYVGWRLANGSFPNGGLSRAMANLKIPFKGTAHQAQDDAENTFHTFRKLVELLKDKK